MTYEDRETGNSGTSTVSNAQEGELTRQIESQTSQLPSTSYLGAAIAAMVGSAILHITGRRHWSLFVGQWAAPFLLMGVYNKLVKQHGSDRHSLQPSSTY